MKTAEGNKTSLLSMTFKWTKLIYFYCQIARLPSSKTAAIIASVLVSVQFLYFFIAFLFNVGKQEKASKKPKERPCNLWPILRNLLLVFWNTPGGKFPRSI